MGTCSIPDCNVCAENELHNWTIPELRHELSVLKNQHVEQVGEFDERMMADIRDELKRRSWPINE